MNYFSIPADFKKETIDKYDTLNRSYENARIIETYGNITQKNFLGSGRSVELLPKIDLTELQDYIQYSQAKGIDFNYTINASHMQNKEFSAKGILEIMNHLGKLYRIGVRSLTVSLPSLMEIIKSSKYDFKIKASVICQVTTPNKALYFKKLGVERIMVDESVNRDFPTMKRIVEAFGENVEVIVNSICHKDCGSRMFHYNQISTDSIELSCEASANYYTHRCLLRRYEDIGNLLKLTWIRPEDIPFYRSIGVKYFKFQGRHTVMNGDPGRTVEGYFKESYDGDLFEFLDMFNPPSRFRVSVDNKKLDGFIQPFYKKENFCDNNCPECNYCRSFAGKCINESELREVYNSAKEFFTQYDKFKMTVDRINDSTKANKNVIDADFEFN